MNRIVKALVIAAAGGTLVAGGATAALADIPDSGVIHGCYKSISPHALSVIDSDKGQVCPSGTKSLSWNQTGPPGPAGPSTAGPAGLDVIQVMSGPTDSSATATCPSDHPYVLGGGGRSTAAVGGVPEPLAESYPSGQGSWFAQATQTNLLVTAWAICAK